MEQIKKIGDVYYYGIRVCRDADEVYQRFREDYHRSLGRNFHLRLNRYGQRKERIHGFGCWYEDHQVYLEQLRKRFGKYGRIKCRMLGLMGISYVRVIGIWDMPKIEEDDVEDWINWVMAKGSGVLYTVGRKPRRKKKRKI